MMIEDKLLHAERVRLEALSLSVEFYISRMDRSPFMPNTDEIVEAAHEFEGFIYHGQEGWPDASDTGE